MKLIIARSDEDKRICHQMRYKIMGEDLGWINTSDYDLPEERDEYDESQSVPFLVKSNDGSPIGTARLIVEGVIPLPIKKHFRLYPSDVIEKQHGRITGCAEGSRFIVLSHDGCRPHAITNLICAGLIEECLRMGLSHMFVSFDYKVFRLFRMLGYPLFQIGEPAFYLGSKTVPTILSLDNYLVSSAHQGDDDSAHALHDNREKRK